MRMKPWDRPARDHRPITADLSVIVTDVQGRGLPKPGSSGDREITIQNPSRRARPRTVYVGKLRRPDQPWYIQWETMDKERSSDERMMVFTFASRDEVRCWLLLSGF